MGERGTPEKQPCVELVGPYSPENIYPRYFRVGAYTRLCIDVPFPVTAEGDTVISWQYDYRDFGMDWQVSRTFLVRRAEDGAFLVRDEREERWQPAESQALAMDIVFDHYRYECEINTRDVLLGVYG